jgi:hypothetical protein
MEVKFGSIFDDANALFALLAKELICFLFEVKWCFYYENLERREGRNQSSEY